MIGIIVVAILVELLEAYWQRSGTMLGSLGNGYYFYRKSVFLFLAMHFGYIYLLFVSLAFGVLNWAIILALTFKSFDIFTKLFLIQKIFIDNQVEDEWISALQAKLEPWYFLIGVFTYPYFIYLALEMI